LPKEIQPCSLQAGAGAMLHVGQQAQLKVRPVVMGAAVASSADAAGVVGEGAANAAGASAAASRAPVAVVAKKTVARKAPIRRHGG